MPLQVPRAKALCNYRGQNPGDLKFNKGDVILLRRQLDEKWYQGEINGVSGIFPASSVEVIKQLPQPPPLCRALYNFDLRDKDRSENQDCLTFLKVRFWAPIEITKDYRETVAEPGAVEYLLIFKKYTYFHMHVYM